MTATTTSESQPAAITSVAGHPVVPEAPLLEVSDLRVEFHVRHGIVVANDSVSYSLNSGETLAIIGESGSGKSVSAMAVMGIIDSPPGFITGGSITYRGVELLTMKESARRQVRGDHVAMVFQDALTALNPVFTVGSQIAEMFQVHRGMSKKDSMARALELLERVKIPAAKERLGNYPHEFSGGMRQRVMIAMSIALDPSVLIADEPTTALDVTVQAQVMDLLAELQADTGMGLLLITHDLGVVAEVADNVAVMYAGRIIETGTINDVHRDPKHPYTLGLMQSMPALEQRIDKLKPIPGSPPDLAHRPSGCAFHPRCAMAREVCRTDDPSLLPVGPDGRTSACHFAEEVQR
jgi:oligopeptide transport system ATP-binding protein